MQKIFTAATGRSGTNFLAAAFNHFARNCIAEHEPPTILQQQLANTPFFRRHPALQPRGRLAKLGRDLQRRYFVTDALLGRAEALQWYDRGDRDRLAQLAQRRLRRIARFERQGYRHYVESSQFFLRTFCYEMYRLAPEMGVIKLIRDPLEVARSSANRKKNIFLNSLPPDKDSNIFRLTDWHNFTSFQLYVHLWIETELKWQAFIETTGLSRYIVVETDKLSDPKTLQNLFESFDIEYEPIDILSPTNTNADGNLPITEISQKDKDEFFHILDRLPAVLRERIPQIEKFVREC